MHPIRPIFCCFDGVVVLPSSGVVFLACGDRKLDLSSSISRLSRDKDIEQLNKKALTENKIWGALLFSAKINSIVVFLFSLVTYAKFFSRKVGLL